MKVKVYVVTSAQPMGFEIYSAVYGTKKEAEKHIRNRYPNARKDENIPNLTSFFCKDKDWIELMFIHEEEVEK